SKNTVILVEVPVHSAGDVLVSFDFNGKSSDGLNFEILPIVPIIDLIEPTGAKIGDKITLVGKHFSEDLIVHFSGGVQSEVEFRDDKVLSTIVPSGATSGPVYLATDNDIQSNNIYFSVSEIL